MVVEYFDEIVKKRFLSLNKILLKWYYINIYKKPYSETIEFCKYETG